MKLAVIPARGGSKRIPHKNVKPFCGKPMIAWSILAAHQSGCFDRIIVSTDDSRIAELSREYGAETPFVRPQELANDHTGTIPVIQHAIRWMQEHGEAPSKVCCIYATAPLVEANDIVRGMQLLDNHDCAYALGVTSYPFPIQRAIRITDTGRVEMFQPEYFNTRSQDLEKAWHDAGQFYWGRTDAWLGGQPIFSAAAAAVILPRYRVQDIDTVEDWTHAELIFRATRTAATH